MSDEHVKDFEQQVRECHRLVYQVAYSVLRDRADAEEIAQDAFLRAYRKLFTLREPQKFRSWVARMSFRLALNRYRATKRSRWRDTSWWAMRPAAVGSVEAIVVEREFQSRVRREIDRLPQKLRAVLLLSAVQELNTRDIAELLKIPEGTVRSRLYLGRKKLWKVCGDEAL